MAQHRPELGLSVILKDKQLFSLGLDSRLAHKPEHCSTFSKCSSASDIGQHLEKNNLHEEFHRKHNNVETPLLRIHNDIIASLDKYEKILRSLSDLSTEFVRSTTVYCYRE